MIKPDCPSHLGRQDRWGHQRAGVLLTLRLWVRPPNYIACNTARHTLYIHKYRYIHCDSLDMSWWILLTLTSDIDRASNYKSVAAISKSFTVQTCSTIPAALRASPVSSHLAAQAPNRTVPFSLQGDVARANVRDVQSATLSVQSCAHGRHPQRSGHNRGSNPIKCGVAAFIGACRTEAGYRTKY